jgi:hypothetical protein
MEEPLSAWMVSWSRSMSCLAMVSASSFCQGGGFGLGDQPADHVAAVDVDDHIQVEVGPFRRPVQLGDVPRPALIRFRRDQFGLHPRRVHRLAATLLDLVVRAQNPIHGGDRGQVGAVVEQLRAAA